jgi:hypothetical protein
MQSPTRPMIIVLSLPRRIFIPLVHVFDRVGVGVAVVAMRTNSSI